MMRCWCCVLTSCSSCNDVEIESFQFEPTAPSLHQPRSPRAAARSGDTYKMGRFMQLGYLIPPGPLNGFAARCLWASVLPPPAAVSFCFVLNKYILSYQKTKQNKYILMASDQRSQQASSPGRS